MAYTGNQGAVTLGGVTYEVVSWTFTDGINALDSTAQGATASTARSFISDGLSNVTGSISFNCTNAKNLPRATTGASAAFTLTDLHATYTGSAIITSSTKTVAVGALTVATVDFQANGAVT